MNRRELMQFGAASALGLVARHALAAPSRRVKVGQVGTAHSHASGKLAAIRKATEWFELVGVVEPDEQRRRAAERRKEYQGVRWLTQEQLLNEPGLEAVVVETGVADCIPAAMAFAAAGMHVHLEKPGGASLTEFRRLVDTVRAKRRVLHMGYMFRYNPAFELCFRAVREGWLGDVYEVHGVIGKVVATAERKALAQFPGGMMFELGCHLIDATVAVLGAPTAVQPHLRKTRPEQDDLADNCLAVFEYPKALATIRSAAVDVEGNARRQFVVCGDKGTVTIQPLEPPSVRLTLTTARGAYPKGTHPVELPRMTGRYDEQMADFAAMVRGEREPAYGFEHAVAVLAVVLRAGGMAAG